KACKAQPVDRTPVWFMRQAGRYMPEYRAVRKQYSLIEICKKPELAAEVTITAAEALGVDAAIVFADLLLPLEVMGLPFHFSTGEGPVIERPVRDAKDIERLRTDRAADLGYVAEAVRLVCKHFGSRLPVIGFCGAPFTLASYMIETGAEVIGLDWRVPLDDGWRGLNFEGAVQGNLDPVVLFANWKEIESRAREILRRAGGRPGHIFNLGHGILPDTSVENVKA